LDSFFFAFGEFEEFVYDFITIESFKATTDVIQRKELDIVQ